MNSDCRPPNRATGAVPDIFTFVHAKRLEGLQVRPTHRNLTRFGDRCPHTHGRQAALNLAGLYKVVPYEHDLAWARDSTFQPKSGEGRVAWGQKLELLSVLDLEEHCSYPAHARLQPAKARRSPGPPRVEVSVIPNLLGEALAAEPHPDIGIFIGDGHYGCAPIVEGLYERDLHLVSKLHCNAVLWAPYTCLPRKGPGRPRKYTGRFNLARIPELSAINLSDEGKRMHLQAIQVPAAGGLRPERRHRSGDGAGAGLPHLPRPLANRVQLPRRQAVPRPGRLPSPPSLPRQYHARGPGLDPARTGPNRAEAALNPLGIRRGRSHPSLRSCISQKLPTPLQKIIAADKRMRIGNGFFTTTNLPL